MSDSYCPDCGQKIRKLNPHHMSKQSVWVLESIAKLNIAGYQWVRVEAGSMLQAGELRVRTAYRAGAHAIYLTWFGLVVDREHRSGEFSVTAEGFQFLAGRNTVPKTIYCQGGRVVKETEERVLIGSVRGVNLDKAYWDDYAAKQIPRDEGRLF